MGKPWTSAAACIAAMGLWSASALSARAAVPNSLVLNEINTVSSGSFLDQDRPAGARNRSDLTLGRLQGNGQNWLEFLVVQGDDLGGGTFANTLDLRGWKVAWSYDKPPLLPTDPDPNVSGSGVMQFSDDPLWAAVPKGTLLVISEWKEVWYHDAGTDPAGFGGLQRDGGIDGLGEVVGEPYDPETHTKKVDFSTDAQWNPLATWADGVHSGTGDWGLRVWAGERNPDMSFKYFTFTGSISPGNDELGQPLPPIDIGTPGAGLYAVNNDDWQFTILEPVEGQEDRIIQGPIGEALSSGSFSVGSDELFRLENFPVTTPPATQEHYLDASISDYIDGTSSAFGRPNVWSGGSFVQDLSSLRNWVRQGDADLDGRSTGSDFLKWQQNLDKTGASLTDGDFNGDGTVDGLDLAVWRTQFGTLANAALRAVPEAQGVVLACLAMGPGWVAALSRKRRRRLSRRIF